MAAGAFCAIAGWAASGIASTDGATIPPNRRAAAINDNLISKTSIRFPSVPI
jgi:hypothetical protein